MKCLEIARLLWFIWYIWYISNPSPFWIQRKNLKMITHKRRSWRVFLKIKIGKSFHLLFKMGRQEQPARLGRWSFWIFVTMTPSVALFLKECMIVLRRSSLSYRQIFTPTLQIPNYLYHVLAHVEDFFVSQLILSIPFFPFFTWSCYLCISIAALHNSHELF